MGIVRVHLCTPVSRGHRTHCDQGIKKWGGGDLHSGVIPGHLYWTDTKM